MLIVHGLPGQLPSAWDEDVLPRLLGRAGISFMTHETVTYETVTHARVDLLRRGAPPLRLVIRRVAAQHRWISLEADGPDQSLLFEVWRILYASGCPALSCPASEMYLSTRSELSFSLLVSRLKDRIGGACTVDDERTTVKLPFRITVHHGPAIAQATGEDRTYVSVDYSTICLHSRRRRKFLSELRSTIVELGFAERGRSWNFRFSATENPLEKWGKTIASTRHICEERGP